MKVDIYRRRRVFLLLKLFWMTDLGFGRCSLNWRWLFCDSGHHDCTLYNNPDTPCIFIYLH